MSFMDFLTLLSSDPDDPTWCSESDDEDSTIASEEDIVFASDR